MSRRRYFEEQRSGNGAIYHCVKTEIEPGDKIRLFNLMNKVKSDTISQDKINSVLNQLREGTAFNIHTQSPVSFSFSSTSTGYEPMSIRITFDPYPTSEQQGIIYKFQINDQRYVFMFSNRYDGMRDLINNADEDLVGGGGGSGNGSGAGSGYTKTYKRNNIGIKQGSQISVTPGQEINIIVGKGGAGLYYGYPEKGGFSQFMNSSYRAEGGNPSGNGLLNGENSTGGPYTGGNGGSGGSVDQSGDEFYAGSDGSDAPGITDGNGIYHPPGTKYGGGKGQGYTTRDFGEPTGKRNAGGGGADRNRDGGMGGESDYDEGCGIGRGNRKSGGYGGGGCGSEGTGGDGTVLIRGKRYKS